MFRLKNVHVLGVNPPAGLEKLLGVAQHKLFVLVMRYKAISWSHFESEHVMCIKTPERDMIFPHEAPGLHHRQRLGSDLLIRYIPG